MGETYTFPKSLSSLDEIKRPSAKLQQAYYEDRVRVPGGVYQANMSISGVRTLDIDVTTGDVRPHAHQVLDLYAKLMCIGDSTQTEIFLLGHTRDRDLLYIGEQDFLVPSKASVVYVLGPSDFTSQLSYVGQIGELGNGTEQS